MNIGELPKFSTGLFLLLCLAFLPACNRSNSDSADSGGDELAQLSGTVSLDGSSTVAPFAVQAADAFQQTYLSVKPTIGVSGTGGGFKRFAAGEIDISNASRPIKADELAKCAENGVEFVELPIAYDGLTIVVHPSNHWVKQLTVDQLRQIFLDGGVTRWNEIQDDWPDAKIHINSPGTDSGTFDYFKEVVAGKDGEIRSDMNPSEDDNVLVTGVAGEPNAIGYFGAAYYFENRNKVKAIPIVNPETQKPVMPEPDTIRSGEYAPFSRPLFIYVNVKSLKRPEVKKFVQFQMDRAGEFAERVQYVPLPDAIYAAAEDHLLNRLTGTHFLTPEGEKREGNLSEIYRAENLNPKP